LSVYSKAPGLALVKNRTIIEYIAKVVFEGEIKQPGGKRMLDELISRLDKESKNVPSNIIALMRTVTYLGNVGGHVEELGREPSSVDACEFTVSFSATIKVADWYFSHYMTRAHS
jgi:hypothetical protein